MAGRKGSFASLVRAELEAKGQASVQDLTRAMIQAAPDRVAGRKVHVMIQDVMRDLVRSGEAVRAAQGVYRWAARKEPVQLRQKMWSILRARRVVSVEDLMELAGASRGYALEWARMLERNELVRRLDDGRVQLLHDPVIMPENTAKAEQLKALRRRAALEKLGAALEMMTEARKELEGAS